MSRAVAGRPSSRKSERQEALRITLQEPRSIKTGLKRIADEAGETPEWGDPAHAAQYGGLRLEAHAAQYAGRGAMKRSFARPRRSSRSCAPVPWLGQGPFDLWYYDEAGFTLQPAIPYAWQRVGQRLELASAMARAKTSWASSICTISSTPLLFRDPLIPTP